jgi:hypothetical protein
VMPITVDLDEPAVRSGREMMLPDG